MSPDLFLTTIIDPALELIATIGGPKPTDDVRRFELCISLQEAGRDLKARYQNSPANTPGPARGRWQMEQGGGVQGVLTHQASRTLAATLCGVLEVAPNPGAVWRALEGHDLLAAGFARLLIWTDPNPVPVTAQQGWDCYAKRLWRPGQPHPDTWPENWKTADVTVAANLLRVAPVSSVPVA